MKYTDKDFKPHTKLSSCTQAAKKGKSIGVDSYGQKFYLEHDPVTGKYHIVYCHEIGDLKEQSKPEKHTIGGGLKGQSDYAKLNKEYSKVKKKKRKPRKLNVKNFVIKPESTKATCSAAESIGRSIITGPRGGRFYNRRSKRSGNYYKVYCKG